MKISFDEIESFKRSYFNCSPSCKKKCSMFNNDSLTYDILNGDVKFNMPIKDAYFYDGSNIIVPFIIPFNTPNDIYCALCTPLDSMMTHSFIASYFNITLEYQSFYALINDTTTILTTDVVCKGRYHNAELSVSPLYWSNYDKLTNISSYIKNGCRYFKLDDNI